MSLDGVNALQLDQIPTLPNVLTLGFLHQFIFGTCKLSAQLIGWTCRASCHIACCHLICPFNITASKWLVSKEFSDAVDLFLSLQLLCQVLVLKQNISYTWRIISQRNSVGFL